MKKSVVIVSGGTGTRFGGDIPKQFMPLANKPIIFRSIETFYNYDNNINIVVVIPKDFLSKWQEICSEYKFTIPVKIVFGGDTRFHSVKNGLMEIEDNGIVAIHDAARPFVSKQIIQNCFNRAYTLNCGAIPVVPEVNSVRIVKDGLSSHFDRSQIRIVQTPQLFPAKKIKQAYSIEFKQIFTDDASVFENIGENIELVEGDSTNIKITTPIDILLGEMIIKNQMLNNC